MELKRNPTKRIITAGVNQKYLIKGRKTPTVTANLNAIGGCTIPIFVHERHMM
jgi:hypothetical protein